MQRALVLTGHFPDEKRRASIHWLSEALRERGWQLDFVTVGQSLASRFRRCSQWPFVQLRPTNRWVELAPGLESYIWYTPLHPMNLHNGVLNAAAVPLYRLYAHRLPPAVRQRAAAAELILCEGPLATMFLRTLRALAPAALLIYNAADRVQTVGAHPLLVEYEARNAPLADLVRVPAQAMLDDYPAGTAVEFVPHGLDARLFAATSANPFSGPRNALCIGDMLFDPWAIEVLAAAFADWTFHLFGVGAQPKARRPNVAVHGEQAFAHIVPFLQHADLGLAPYRDRRESTYLAQSSLKMMQYSYCQLPIVAPWFAVGRRRHVQGYRPGDAASLCAAFTRAVAYDRRDIAREPVLSWDEVLERILRAATQQRQQRLAKPVDDVAPV